MDTGWERIEVMGVGRKNEKEGGCYADSYYLTLLRDYAKLSKIYRLF